MKNICNRIIHISLFSVVFIITLFSSCKEIDPYSKDIDNEQRTSQAILEELYKCEKVTVTLEADIQTETTDDDLIFYGHSIYVDNDPIFQMECSPLVWNGNKFCATFNYEYYNEGEDVPLSSKEGSICGEISADGKTLLSIVADMVFVQSSGRKEQITKIALSNIPYNHTEVFSIEGLEIKDHVVMWEYTRNDIDSWGNLSTLKGTSIDYYNSDVNRLLFVYFRE